jgi:type VI secretion system protein ImpH
MGSETDALTFFAALADAPHRYDFYQTLRRLECLYEGKPRWGQALRPVDEPVRLGQDPDLAFAPSPLASLEAGQERAAPRLQVRLFGLLGPNGPLPIHVTECARERLRHAGDPTLSRFLDLFHHRFLALFYRAWAQAQPHVNRDRPDEDRFGTYVGAFAGVAPAPFHDRDTVPDPAKLFHAGLLMRPVRNAEGLAAILQNFFRAPVKVHEFVGHWMPLSTGDRTRLASGGAGLGSGAVLGRRVWDRQHKFRLRIGPLTLPGYESFLPGGERIRQLVDWVRLYFSFEHEWDVCLVLRNDDVPPLMLGQGARLGWTTWLGTRPSQNDADDLCVNAEAFV